MPEVTSKAIQQVSWTAQSSTLSHIRRRVFIEEQGVAESEEWDGLDESARHFLAFAPSGEAAGTARVLVKRSSGGCPAASYHIGRVAVLPSWRRRGLGRALMREVISWCREDASPQCAYIHLNAQRDRLEFYQQLGFRAQGELFMDAGIPHRAMILEPQT